MGRPQGGVNTKKWGKPEGSNATIKDNQVDWGLTILKGGGGTKSCVFVWDWEASGDKLWTWGGKKDMAPM